MGNLGCGLALDKERIVHSKRGKNGDRLLGRECRE